MEIQRVPSFVTLPPRVWPAGSHHYGYGHGSGRPDLGNFVPGGFPVPWNVIALSGLADFVDGGFPLPQSPVYYPSSEGSLPKAPDMPMALIANGNGKSLSGLGCGCGGSCGDCGMGDIAVPSWASSLPAFLQGSATLPAVGSVPMVYVIGGAIVAAMLFFGGGSASRRRR